MRLNLLAPSVWSARVETHFLIIAATPMLRPNMNGARVETAGRGGKFEIIPFLYGWERELKSLNSSEGGIRKCVPIWMGTRVEMAVSFPYPQNDGCTNMDRARVETVMDAAEWNLPVVPIWIKRELKYYIQGNQEKAIPIWIGLE